MSLQITDDAPLAGLNTFGVAASARRLVILDNEQDLPAALAACTGFADRCVLGGGSNVLFAGDFDGAILLMRTTGREILAQCDDRSSPERLQTGARLIDIQAGESWDAVVQWSLAQGLPGLENLSMIPGTCGAAAIQNIGAYGLELSDRFESLRAVHLRTGETRLFDQTACRFGYRDSVFKQPDGRDWLILTLRLRVGPCHRPVLSYAELSARFPTADSAPTAAQIAAAVRAIRSTKLPDPAVLGNAGSFFKNPVVSAADAQRLRHLHPALPTFPAAANACDAVKLSAGWLIERCGWKGHREGDAGVHQGHALVLVNHGTATGAQLLTLAERIRTSVHERFGVWLAPEPLILGSP